MASTTRIANLRQDLPIALTEDGSGRPVLILHGGGGPFTVAPIAGHLASTMRAITPTLPGWNGNPRPDTLAGIGDYAAVYLELLDAEDLRDVLVIGSSLGGWLAAEMAARDTAGRISGLILIDATGIRVDDQPIVDFFSLDARGVAEHAWYDPDRGYRDPATIPPEQAAVQRANMATMAAIATPMYAPDLMARLSQVRIPVLVAWGEADRIVTPAYGAAYAAAFPEARFERIAKAGHLPHLEQPAATFAVIDDFLAGEGALGAR
jgi:pimeloyl-ACP methyl ester carboxylesterase